MKRSKSSKRWLREHFSDEYVKQAQKTGLRSRSAYKLLEIDAKDRLFKPGMKVVDLGAAPGGWSQIAAQKVAENGRVFALDILPMDPIAGVEFIQGDFASQEALDALQAVIADQDIDLVICDIAPNMSGIRAVDQPRSMYLIELSLDFAKQVLRPGGVFLAKVFQGEGFDELMRELRAHFGKVVVRKPKASRSRSQEVYCLAKDFQSVK